MLSEKQPRPESHLRKIELFWPKSKARPEASSDDQPRQNRISQGVRNLIQDVGLGAKRNETRWFRGPNVLPSTEESVDELSREHVDEFHEKRGKAIGVRKYAMPVVGHDANGMNLNRESLAGAGEDIAESEGDVPVRAQEELPLGTATGQEIGCAGNNLSRK